MILWVYKPMGTRTHILWELRALFSLLYVARSLKNAGYLPRKKGIFLFGIETLVCIAWIRNLNIRNFHILFDWMVCIVVNLFLAYRVGGTV